MTDLEEELAPFRTWYEEELGKLELRYAHEMGTHLSDISQRIHPLEVSMGYVRKCLMDDFHLTAEHNKRAGQLWDEFMVRTADIWKRYE